MSKHPWTAEITNIAIVDGGTAIDVTVRAVWPGGERASTVVRLVPDRWGKRLIMCDCSAADACPQGKVGSERRCTIVTRRDGL